MRSALPSQIEIEGRIRDGSIGLLPAQRVTESFGRQTGEWKPVELVLDVPETADGILLSIGVRGAGKAWFDDARLRIASKDAPLSAQTDLDRAGRTDMPLRPSNLDFEQTDLR